MRAFHFLRLHPLGGGQMQSRLPEEEVRGTMPGMDSENQNGPPEGDATLYRLVMLEGPEPDRRYIIRQSSVLLGSDPKCRVQIEDPSIAGQHLALRETDGKVRITVLDQADPILFDDEPVWERYLEHGDIFCAGDVRFQYEDMVPLPFYKTRPRGLIDRVSVGAVGVIFGLQVLLLCILAFVNGNEIGEGELNLPSAEALAAMSPEEFSRLTNELTQAQAELVMLERSRASQSAEEIWDGRQSVRLAGEIEAMRKRVDFLDESIGSALVLGQEDEALPEEASPVEAPDPNADSRKILTDARRAIAAGQLEAADAILARLQDEAPDLVGAYITRARLFERMKLPQDAIAQWDEVLNRVAGTETYEEATAERTRLVRLVRRQASEARAAELQAADEMAAERREAEARLANEAENRLAKEQEAARVAEAKAAKEKEGAERAEQALAAKKRAAEEEAARLEREAKARAAEREAAFERAAAAVRAPDVEPAKTGPRKIRIASMRREKFENRENYEEIRLVRVGLTSRKSEAPPRGEDVQVEVVFFDRDQDSGKVEVSRVPSPKKGLAVDGEWADATEQTLSALYMVPKGFRRAEEQKRGAKTQYYGFVVRVFYQGALQDEEAFPESLLERSRGLL